ncbi:UNVERIFIED_CONTAM: U-box domain-containing protein 52 [Sesamum radiatum]|uniref:RING-type E3 ubiquitin transferase n=1 Tax=Sesamum radiatum TaxID=300843 RepID=A0AAW2PIS3_SESRA
MVAIDQDKNSQFAVRWAVEKLRLRDNQIILVHVRTQQSHDSKDIPEEGREPNHAEAKQLFLSYRSICARKGVRAKEVMLHGHDVANKLCQYIGINCITSIVLGAASRGALARAFKFTDVPSSVAKHAPDSCSVYAVSKGKVQKLKSSTKPETPSSATCSIPRNAFSPETTHAAKFHPQESWKSAASDLSYLDGGNQPRISVDSGKSYSPLSSGNNSREYQQITPIERPSGSKTPFHQNLFYSSESLQAVPVEKQHGGKGPGVLESANISNESIVYSSNYSSSHDSGAGDSEFGQVTPLNRQQGSKISAILQSMNDLNLEVRTKGTTYSVSGSSDHSEVLSFPSDVSFEILDQTQISDSWSSSSSRAAEKEDELRRLKQELKEMTMKYDMACQEAVTAKDKVRGISQWKSEANELEEAQHAQEAALAIVEREKLKCKVAVEVAYMAQRIAELESEKRKQAEMKFKKEAEERQKVIDSIAYTEIRYRRYTMDEIAVATNYFSSSEKVEVLSRMRHPHMVILLGACPEYGCLVYEYMQNGSLEDRLFCRDGSRPLSWRTRFRIAAEIATALNFLHRTRPDPLVHRDLKPANILLDKNYVSKISDVGLCRLVPPSMADSVTQYHMTAAAGTFCYIDPEYQQTGMLGTKSDIYSLGVMLLQIITAKPAMGLTHHVETAIESGRFAEILDPTVNDWPVEEALSFAKLALQCCELRRRDRPDLDSVILPEMERLRDLGSQSDP